MYHLYVYVLKDMELDDFFPVIMLYLRQLPAAEIGFICQIYCDLSVKQ